MGAVTKLSGDFPLSLHLSASLPKVRMQLQPGMGNAQGRGQAFWRRRRNSIQVRRGRQPLREKGGKDHAMPTRHNLEHALAACMDGAGLAGDAKGRCSAPSGEDLVS